MSSPTSRVGFRFITVTTALSIFLLTVFSTYNYRATEKTLIAQQNQQVQSIITRLQTNVPPAIWGFNASQVRSIVESEVKSDAIHAIAVFDEFEVPLSAAVTDSDGGVSQLSANDIDGVFSTHQIEVLLTLGDETVGSAVIIIDDSEIKEALRHSIKRVLIQNIVLVLTLLAIVAWLVHTLVVKPIKAIGSALHEIADGDGDLTKRLVVQRNDEMGELAGYFNEFVVKISALVAQVVQTVEKSTGAVERTKQSAKKSNEIVDVQKTQIDKVVFAINQLGEAASAVAHRTEAAAKEAENANNDSHIAKELVELTIDTIMNLAHEIEQGCRTVKNLEREVTKIGSILEVIHNIAEQTNLLALNAAIEAARAGDQGRGFAVVADEVRTLANRTQASTGEIDQMIAQLESSARIAVTTLEAGRARSIDTIDKAKSASNALEKIVTAVALISDLNAQIANSTSEQKLAVTDVGGGLRKISEMSLASESHTKELTDTSEQLDFLSKQLSTVVAHFSV